jgi:hypothetical protein
VDADPVEVVEMSWILIVSLAIFGLALVLIEVRAIRTGDERQQAGPGFLSVTCGVILLALGVAAAIAGDETIALATSAVGLAAVAVGASARRRVPSH